MAQAAHQEGKRHHLGGPFAARLIATRPGACAREHADDDDAVAAPFDSQSTLLRLQRHLEPYGQGHVLAFWQSLSRDEQQALAREIDALDLKALQEALSAPEQAPLPPLEDLHTVPLMERDANRSDTVAIGEQVIAQGKVGVLTVAGGQGTRLGFDGPKGTFAIGPLSGLTLFEWFAQSIRKAAQRYGRAIPWAIMTSEATDAPTRAFFEAHDFLGLSRDQVLFFCQGSMPAVSPQGAILLQSRSSIARAPDGHGGVIAALHRSGCLQQLAAQGVSHLSYFQVDNPMVRCIDPWFVGAHVRHGADMSCKALFKAHDHERLGNFCLHQGRLMCIEYSDLPESYARARLADGIRRFNAGNISVYMIAVPFLQRLAEQSHLLPYHRARKKAPFIDLRTGRLEQPSAPNAIKFEKFLFDVLPLARSPLVVRADRNEEFGPVKQMQGEDSVAQAQQALMSRACRWLAAAGVPVPVDDDGAPAVRVEITPSYADSAEAVAEHQDLPVLRAGTSVLLK